ILTAVYDIGSGLAPKISSLGVGAIRASEIRVQAWPGVMICADIDLGGDRIRHLVREERIEESSPFSCFAPCKPDTSIRGRRPIDVLDLMTRDIGAQRALGGCIERAGQGKEDGSKRCERCTS